ncbi:MAG: nucleotide exchange factor GrpE [Clostridia bacterium]|nr:nucleotide exchange factor GrpE [Clostridia bacterium]
MAKKDTGKTTEKAKETEAKAAEEEAAKEPVQETEPAAEEQKAEEVKEPTPLEKAQALAEDYKRKWYNVSAEYDNYRKRNSTAVSKAYADGAADTLLKLLPVADNFGYALDSAQDDKTRTGIEKVIKSFNTILASLGVEEIPIKPGDPVDESDMEAVLSFPCEEGEAPNTVKAVLKKGYRSGGKVIRYAQVSVTTE